MSYNPSDVFSVTTFAQLPAAATANGRFCEVGGAVTMGDGLGGLYWSNGTQWLLLLDATETNLNNQVTEINAEITAINTELAGLTGAATQLTAAVAAGNNIGTSAVPATIDGYAPQDGDVIFLAAQTNAAQNGLWVYSASGNSLSRPTDNTYNSGQTVTVPFYVSILYGVAYAGNIFELESPQTVVVDTTASTWVTTSGKGEMAASAFMAGPSIPYYPPAISSLRNLVSTDMPFFQASEEISARISFPYLSLNNFGYVSRYIQSSNPWNHSTAVSFAAYEHNVIIFDKATYLATQLTPQAGTKWSGKKFVFTGSGPSGPNRSFMTSNSSFIDLSGCSNVEFEGQCVIEYINPLYTANAIKWTSALTNFKADRIYTIGAAKAVYADAAVNGLNINSIGVDSVASSPFVLISAAASAGEYNRIGQVEGLAIIQNVTPSANITIIPFQYSPVVVFNVGAAAPRTMTLSLQNTTHGYRQRFQYPVMSSSAITIAGATNATLTGGDQCEFVFDGATATWVLLSYGSI